MKRWSEIRRRVLVEGVSKRAILRETGMHWTTLEKILKRPSPPGYPSRRPRAQPLLGPHVSWLEEILIRDRELPKKQRHTAQRLFDRLRQERGYEGATRG